VVYEKERYEVSTGHKFLAVTSRRLDWDQEFMSRNAYFIYF